MVISSRGNKKEMEHRVCHGAVAVAQDSWCLLLPSCIVLETWVRISAFLQKNHQLPRERRTRVYLKVLESRKQ